MWTRPALCRLCECPASDGGVRVEQLDAGKLSEWWRRTIGTEFTANETSEQQEVFCQFCVWDARLMHEYTMDATNSGLHNECDWWSGFDSDNSQFLRNYYQEKVIHPCKVELGVFLMKNIHTSESHSCASNAGNHGLVLVSKTKSQEERCKTSKICEFCHRRYAFNTTKMHFKKFHSSENLIRCSYRNCCTYFRSEDEKLKHEEQKHAAANKRTCIFCNLFYSKDIMRSHLRETHKEQLLHAFKCTFRCPEFFLTETELNKHIECVHKKLQNLPEIKCIYCDKLSRDKNVLAKHINYKHSDVKILCKIRGCCQYFHTQTQLDSHSEQMHVNEKEIKRYKCSKCDFRSNQNYALNRHVAAKHQAENVENVVCRKCGKHFSSSTSLKNHIANVHTYSNVCEHCDKKIVKMSFHKIQSICKSCNQVLMCLQSAKLHNKQCKGKK